jgi:ABC-type protease/lipase transport system fused ATPase/permease subunit
MYYDGILTSSLNLDALRSSIIIIPQAPELLSGTLRKNLDMFGQRDDAELNDALRSAGLFSLQTDADKSRLTLDSQVAAGGGNLSRRAAADHRARASYRPSEQAACARRSDLGDRLRDGCGDTSVAADGAEE